VVLHAFMEEGHFGRHVRRMRMLYGERADALRATVKAHLAGTLKIPAIAAGFDTPAFLPPALDDRLVAARAEQAGLEVRALSSYAIARPAPAGLVLGFAAVGIPEIEAGVATLARVIEGAIPAGHGSVNIPAHPLRWPPEGHSIS